MSWAAVAGAAVGVVGNKLGSKQGGSTTQSSAPWEGQMPYLTRGYYAADKLLSKYSKESEPVLQYQELLKSRGLSGSPVETAAQNLAASTMRGDYLNSNPFLDQAVSRAAGEAQSRINSQFGPFSNYGSSAHQEWLGRGIMGAALPMLAQNYENERARQFAALSQAPALQGMDYTNINALQQANLAPWDFLGRYTQNVSGNPGGGSQTTPYFTNPVNSALGGAMLGNQLYNSYQNNQSPSLDTSWLGTNMGYGY